MAYLSKANTMLKRELESKITGVLESFTYDEIVSDSGAPQEDVLYPFRYYTKSDTCITACLLGEKNLAADAEIMAAAVNALLGAEIDDFVMKIGNSALQKTYPVCGAPSLIDEMDEESDALFDVSAVCDLLSGYGIAEQYITVDLTEKEEKASGIFFRCTVGEKVLCCGYRSGADVVLQMDMLSILDHKKGGKDLKEPVPVVLVASDMPDTAYQVAFGLRRQGLKTEGFISGGSMYEAEEYCNLKGIPTLVWAGDNKVVMKNIQSGETAETTLDRLLGTAK